LLVFFFCLCCHWPRSGSLQYNDQTFPPLLESGYPLSVLNRFSAADPIYLVCPYLWFGWALRPIGSDKLFTIPNNFALGDVGLCKCCLDQLIFGQLKSPTMTTFDKFLLQISVISACKCKSFSRLLLGLL
jgi:hypothetical protein